MSLLKESVDRSTILEQLGGDEEILHEIIDMFLASLPESIGRIRTTMNPWDAAKAEREAHKFKGAVGNFTRGTAYRAAADIERFGKENRADLARERFDVLVDAASALERDLRTMSGNHSLSV